MANENRGYCGVKAPGGKTLNLVLGINEICELEDMLDLSMPEIILKIDDPQKARIKIVRAIWWSMMLREQPESTVEDAGLLMDFQSGKFQDILDKALDAAFPAPKVNPDQDGGDVEKSLDRAPGTG